MKARAAERLLTPYGGMTPYRQRHSAFCGFYRVQFRGLACLCSFRALLTDFVCFMGRIAHSHVLACLAVEWATPPSNTGGTEPYNERGKRMLHNNHLLKIRVWLLHIIIKCIAQKGIKNGLN